MYTGILRTIYTLSLLTIAIVVVTMGFGRHEMHGEYKDRHSEKTEQVGEDETSSEEVTALMETVDMQKAQISELQQVVQQNIMSGENLTFFLQKTLEKTYTEEEISAMVTEYQELVTAREEEYKAQMEAAQNAPAAVPAAQ